MLKNAVRILQGPCIKHPEHPIFARGYVLQGFRRLGYHNAQNVWAPRFESLLPKKQLGLGSAGALALACAGRRPVGSLGLGLDLGGCIRVPRIK